MSTIADLLAATASRLPGKTALVFQDRPISYGDLQAEVVRASAGIAALGVRKGDRVAVLVHNIPHFVYAYCAIVRLGAVMVPINTMFTSDEISTILADSEARVVVVAEPFITSVDGLRETLPMLEHVVVCGDNAPMGTMTWEQMVGRGTETAAAVVADDDLICLPYTSGTTGTPKGAMLSTGNMMANLAQMSKVPALKEVEDDVVLMVLPLFHIYALNVILGLTIREGATAVLLERFDPVASLDAMEKHSITVLFGAPPMFVAWLSAPDVESRDLSSVRLALSGAAPLPGPVLEEFQRRLGITLWEGYGLTETAPGLTSTAMGGASKPGSIGMPLPDVELRLVDEHDEDVEDGDPGEIVVRGPNIFRGYWHHDDDTAVAMRGGWFHTGDVAFEDEDGYLTIVDRKKDLIIVSGFNVYPREVEDALYRHPKVAEAAVVGVPHPYTGEAVKAFVVLKPGERATDEEIIDSCKRSIARFKCPQVVSFVDQLPHTVTGKVMRRALREGED